MQTVTAERLAETYGFLYAEDTDDIGPFENWLERYNSDPSMCVAKSNWYGKVTKALFMALDIPQPKTVRDMLAVLRQD